MYELVNDQLKLSLRDAAGKVTATATWRAPRPHDRPGQRGPPTSAPRDPYTQVADTQFQATQSPLDRLPDLPHLPPATR